MQFVQAGCNTQFAQIACHATLAQEWCDMQSVQAECPNVDRLHVRGSCFVTFLVLIPKSAIRVRRDEASGHNDSSRSSMPRHASKSIWTQMHVLASSSESCHCDHWLRLVSLLWLTLESEPERSRNMIHEHAICPHWGTQLAQIACHTTPAQEWHAICAS